MPPRCQMCGKLQAKGHEPFCKPCHEKLQNSVSAIGLNLEVAKGRPDLYKSAREERAKKNKKRRG